MVTLSSVGGILGTAFVISATVPLVKAVTKFPVNSFEKDAKKTDFSEDILKSTNLR